MSFDLSFWNFGLRFRATPHDEQWANDGKGSKTKVQRPKPKHR